MDVTGSQLLELIPHRPPILMLDEVVSVVPGERGAGVRTFLEGDPVFAGHFPGHPIVPGVLTIEAFAQTALVVAVLDESRGKVDATAGRLAKCNEMAFLGPVLPGRKVIFSVAIERRVGSFMFVDCEARAEEKIIATGKLTLKI